ncbi:hypothetical protein B0H10DRAFT_2064379 [Mycena sp. CBHHK59/15]|nr:hypothetical protein B0H10DRAFT_2064379 [Mycena sp. CBHHK59/15]
MAILIHLSSQVSSAKIISPVRKSYWEIARDSGRSRRDLTPHRITATHCFALQCHCELCPPPHVDMISHPLYLSPPRTMSQWIVQISTSRGAPYYFNTETKESSWSPPPELSEDQVNALLKASQEAKSKSGQVRASHLLVKHNGSRRPSSWKENKITRSKEEAIEILRGYQAQIGTSTDKFAELATTHSDCSSHDQGGNLGWFGHGQMQKPFEDAAYGLQVGQISDVISTDSGVHLVMRTG